MSHFRPADEREHRRGNAGYPVSDWCANCGTPFMEHNNGVCPEADDEDDE